ncbi:MAG TPA: aminotransferase class IV [Candidatus Manganitrophaceae bacterium]|nr:aminotransferase class IV [Candidatus Manganitrophaceae bacterium]
MWIFVNGRFVPKEKARVSVYDHGFLYGDGLFETLRAYSGTIFRLPQHLERLARSAQRLTLSLPPLFDLEALLYKTLERNRLRDAILRLTVTRGEGAVGLDPDLCGKPTLVILARRFKGYPSEFYEKGVSAAIVQVRRTPPAALDPAFKSISFLNNVQAKIEANRRGAFEGIFLSLDGYLAEGTVSNLFWVRKGKLKTPAPGVGLLEGVTRGLVLQLAKKSGVRTEEGRFRPSDLLKAEEAFLTNSGVELAPLTEVEGKAIGGGKPGPITRQLHQAFKEAVRQR